MKPSDTLKLDNQICFLLYAASRRMTAVYTPLLDALELTYPQYLVLLVLWERDGVDVGYIADKLMLDTGTVSPLLKNMQNAGLINRKRDSDDERKVILTLTDKGVSLKEKALNIPKTVFQRSGCSSKEYLALKAELSGLLKRIS
jgi:DNA-binding MarR family transcriptional regulator